jgi:hypothetical protein
MDVKLFNAILAMDSYNRDYAAVHHCAEIVGCRLLFLKSTQTCAKG